MPYFTPNLSEGETTFTLTIPDFILPYVVGALLEASEVRNWELWGDASIEQCVDALSTIILAIPNSL